MSFVQFAGRTLTGLGRAYTSDIDVFLLGTAGLLRGRKGLSTALLVYVVARRADQYVTVVASKADLIASVMARDGAPF